jgi:very-short-patch-repair endonuclease
VEGRKRDIYNLLSKAVYRKELRNNATKVERILWQNLKGRKLAGKKFRRQFSVGPYIVDFYCPECRLAIELDGAGHFTILGGERDAIKLAYLEKCGIRVLHFENKLMYTSLEWVLEVIKDALRAT